MPAGHGSDRDGVRLQLFGYHFGISRIGVSLVEMEGKALLQEDLEKFEGKGSNKDLWTAELAQDCMAELFTMSNAHRHHIIK